MKLTDEQMVEALKDAGHTEAATALEQKVNAAAAVDGEAARAEEAADREAGEPAATKRMPDGPGPARIARGYQEAEAAKGAGS